MITPVIERMPCMGNLISPGISTSVDVDGKEVTTAIVDQLREDIPIEVLMIDELSIVETDKVNHTVETDMMKLVVEIECFGVNFDEFDKETGSSDELQPKQAGLNCVHALNEPHLHEIHVVPNKHEADRERLARCLAAHAPPSSPLPIVPHPYGSPNHVRAPPGFRAAMGRLRASSPSTHHPLHPSPPLPHPPSSLHLPPHVPTLLPLPSSPLPPLRALLFIPLSVYHREDIPEAELPPRKRLCLTALTSRYEVEESSSAAPRPTGEPIEAVEEVAPTTLEGVNARVTELAAVQEQDIQDIYDVIEVTQTQLFQRVDGLVEDRKFHYETARLLNQEALVSREALAHSVGLRSVVHYELQAYRTHTQMQDYCIASQESLMTTLITHVSSLQGQLSAALGQIQALRARDQTHVDDREGLFKKYEKIFLKRW
ncbi:hypothetical protein Tco_1284413 [Tanacetum coccineum]